MSLGEGQYRWINTNGSLETGSHWDHIPNKILDLIVFLPYIPPEPHTEEIHKSVEKFPDKMKEVLNRCLYNPKFIKHDNP